MTPDAVTVTKEDSIVVFSKGDWEVACLERGLAIIAGSALLPIMSLKMEELTPKDINLMPKYNVLPYPPPTYKIEIVASLFTDGSFVDPNTKPYIKFRKYPEELHRGPYRLSCLDDVLSDGERLYWLRRVSLNTIASLSAIGGSICCQHGRDGVKVANAVFEYIIQNKLL
jgi:hypothetical protein